MTKKQHRIIVRTGYIILFPLVFLFELCIWLEDNTTTSLWENIKDDFSNKTLDIIYDNPSQLDY